jgi:hypothetical protein
MKRPCSAFIVAISVSLSVPFGAALAHASPSPSTSVTLSCDKGVDATVALTLQPSDTDATFLGRVEISCGPHSNVSRQRNRVDVPTGALAAGWVVVDAWTNSTGDAPASCVGEGPVTYKASCSSDAGGGSQLVVR